MGVPSVLIISWLSRSGNCRGQMGYKCSRRVCVPATRIRPPSKHDTLPQCWANVGPASTTQGQHYPSIESMCRVCWLSGSSSPDRVHKQPPILSAGFPRGHKCFQLKCRHSHPPPPLPTLPDSCHLCKTPPPNEVKILIKLNLLTLLKCVNHSALIVDPFLVNLL